MADDRTDDIRLLCLDVDGVLTDGSILIDDHGVETKRFHVRDGTALRLWMDSGRELAIITGRSGVAVRHRAAELGITRVLQGVADKQVAFGAVLDDLGLLASQSAMLGDDLPDLPILHLAGYPMAVADAVPEVREAADYVTIRPGGRGAVREAIEHLLKGADVWDDLIARFAPHG
ncbi:MAG: KdsC family phosphatase [Planctomycetota bacterium]|jgi:3-deoxy-D-manno-octulosonate 8-phosphate phosphatase (KDO 8-P phosphatase)